MTCPKCGYLGYEDVDRCRNCGFEFVLSAAARAELRLRTPDHSLPQPLADLELGDAAPRVDETEKGRSRPHNLSSDQAGRETAELPLFSDGDEDAPLITKAPPPRQPLSVRRATVEVPRLPSEARTQRLEPVITVAPTSAVPNGPESVGAATEDMKPAQVSARAAAAAVDLALLALVDLIIVYFALKICRLEANEWALLPKVPLVAFFVLQNAGYLVAFTATGQTLGKMLTGLRVVTADGQSTPGLRSAAIRAMLWMLLALPAGAGLLPTLFARDGRGVHDRLAGTRVVRITH